MNLNKLVNICDKEKLNIIDYDFNNINGIYVENCRVIGMNKHLKSAEYKTTLAHELAHYYTDSTYTLLSDQVYIDKQEYRANKWAINTLISIEDLKLAVFNGYTTNYTLADYFEVTEDFIIQAINYYKEKGLF